MVRRMAFAVFPSFLALLLTVSGGIVALLGILMTLNPTVRAMDRPAF